jgi:hypothetical protein
MSKEKGLPSSRYVDGLAIAKDFLDRWNSSHPKNSLSYCEPTPNDSSRVKRIPSESKDGHPIPHNDKLILKHKIATITGSSRLRKKIHEIEDTMREKNSWEYLYVMQRKNERVCIRALYKTPLQELTLTEQSNLCLIRGKELWISANRNLLSNQTVTIFQENHPDSEYTVQIFNELELDLFLAIFRCYLANSVSEKLLTRIELGYAYLIIKKEKQQKLIADDANKSRFKLLQEIDKLLSDLLHLKKQQEQGVITIGDLQQFDMQFKPFLKKIHTTETDHKMHF